MKLSTAGFAHFVNGHEIRVVQRRQRQSFALEACDAFHVGDEMAREDFERDPAVELHLAREVNLAHPART